MREPLTYNAKDVVIQGSLIDLSDKDRIWRAVEGRVRTSVRKNQRQGVTIRPFDQGSEELEALRAMTPNDDDIPETFEDRHHAYVAVDDKTGERLGWILLAGVGRKLFMLCHASTPAGKKKETPNALLWHAIEQWTEGTYRYLDVGASYRPSLQKFFSGYRQHSYPMIMRPPELPLDLRITPFDTAAYGMAPGDPNAGRLRLAEELGTDEFTVFPRAMFAIAACMREYRDRGILSEDDEVYISTTTETPYISSHVTRPVESVCRWSQTLSDRTKAVFMIHEFGFPNPRAAELRRLCDDRGIPLIEDLAYGWGSEGTGTWGDVRIYSATKMFPVQFGGFLAGMRISFERMWNVHRSSDLAKEHDLLSLVAAQEEWIGEIAAKRRRIWRKLADATVQTVEPYFGLPDGVLPAAFIAKLRDEDEMKRVSAFMRQFGIEAGNWYHHASVFLPCHQRMTDRHADYVAGSLLANFREGCGLPH